MNAPTSGSRKTRGFTLIEMMVSTVILALLVGFLAPVFTTTTRMTTNSEETLDVDVLARQALDRIGRDLELMPLRPDMNYFLGKLSGNDEFDFFSNVPGVLPTGSGSTETASGLTLVSYRVVEGNLERLAVAQTFGSLSFLSYDTDGNQVTGTGISAAAGTTDDYQILCSGIFRFELGFLLKDGSYSGYPMNEALNTSQGLSAGDLGYRETWDEAKGFAEYHFPEDAASYSLRPLGWQDVAAVIVTIAVIDPVGAARATTTGLETAAGNLRDAVDSTDPTTLVLPAEDWRGILGTPGSLGIPQSLQNSVKVYQRSFYLNNL